VILTASPGTGSRFDGLERRLRGDGRLHGRDERRPIRHRDPRQDHDRQEKATLAGSIFTATKGGVVTLPIGNPNGVGALGDVVLTTQTRVGTKRKEKTIKIGHATFTVAATASRA
jgi:hypothetical protein